jgi:hypothetical protein
LSSFALVAAVPRTVADVFLAHLAVRGSDGVLGSDNDGGLGLGFRLLICATAHLDRLVCSTDWSARLAWADGDGMI